MHILFFSQKIALKDIFRDYRFHQKLRKTFKKERTWGGVIWWAIVDH